MKSREKIFLVVMILLFALSVTMFYYQNVYRVKEAEKDMVAVLVAKADISKNSEINDENTKWIKINKELSSKDNVFQKDDISKMKVSADIFEGEFINKKRLKNTFNAKEDDKFNSYVINLKPDYSSELVEGDLVKVYVQIVEEKDGEKDGEKKIENLLVFDKKEVLEIVGLTEDGRVRQGEEQIKIKVTDKEALSYYNARQMGSVIVLKYENDINKTDLDIPVIEILE